MNWLGGEGLRFVQTEIDEEQENEKQVHGYLRF